VRGNDYSSLLNDKAIRRWRDNVARGSVITAEVYLRRLGHFCKDLEIVPGKLLEMSEDELYDLLLDTVSNMEGKGYAGGYIHSTVKAIKSWLVHNRKEVRGRIKIRGAQDTPTLKDERVPLKNELKRIFLAGDEKSRAACVLMAHGGLRPETIGHYHGNDGLTLRDLPELCIENREVTFLKVPTMVIVRRELSKAGHQYFTFLGQEACDYLRDYLEGRLREEEQLTLDSAIITPKQKMKTFIRTSNVGDAIRVCIRKAGFPWRPYVLRSYFDTQLMLAESKGLVLRDYRQFWMGHKGDIEGRYTTNKQKLPESVVEDMRTAYARSEEFLQTKAKDETSEEKLRGSVRKQLLLVAGLSQEDLDKMDVASMSDEELQSLIRKKLLGLQGSNGGSQKVISVAEANNYLAKGWEYVAKISDNQVIIKLNHGENV
jgi:integrase